MDDDVALAAQGGSCSVSGAEWKEIEAVPPQTRRVGLLFQRAAEALRRPREERRRVFDVAAYRRVLGEGAAAKGAKKAEQLRQKTEEALLRADRERAAAAAAADAPPRLEQYGGRLESFVHAALLWLGRLPPLPAAVAASRFRADLARVEAVPPDVWERLAVLERGDGRPLRALRELCAAEETLALAPGPLDGELQLHVEQERFVRSVRDAALRPGAALLLAYRTPPSGGKTSASALLGAALADLKGLYVFYACYSRTVRVDVAKHLVAASVPFAVVVRGVATPSYSCYHGKARKAKPPPPELSKRAGYSLGVCAACDRVPAVLVCDLQSVALLLSERQRDVLLLDEPTADLGAGMAAAVREILRRGPRITVLMSATMPALERLPGLVQDFARRHGEAAATVTIGSERLPMSVTALDARGLVRAPHEFGVPPDVIEADGHLRRFYSPQALLALAPAEEELCFSDLLSYEAVRAACLRLLRAGRRAAAPAAAPAAALRLELFCGPQAARLPGASLLILDEPRDFLGALELNLEGLPSLKRLVAAKRKPAERGERGERGNRAERGERGERGEREGGRKQLEEEERSGWAADERGAWPRSHVVNTKEHLRRFGTLQGFPERLFRAELPLAEDVRDRGDAALVEAAFSGVLFVGGGDAAFEAAAQTLAEHARESFVVSDRQLVFGINLPFERVVAACAPLSYAEMRQLCGRAGRTGRAAKAEVVFLSEAALRAACVPDDGAADGFAAAFR